MRMCLRAAMLGAFTLVLSSIPVQAAVIVPGATGGGCGGLSASSSCSIFAIDPFATANLSGQFQFDNDIALFAFTLTAETMFSAATSSYGAGGFDPTIGLFTSTGDIVQYPDPNDPTAIYPARGVDIDPDNGNYDDMLPMLRLGPGTYYFALMQYPNSFQGSGGIDSLRPGFSFDDDPLFNGGCADNPLRCNFSFSITAHPVDTNPVPEPGTMSLLALGSAAAGLVRRRGLKVAHRPSSFPVRH